MLRWLRRVVTIAPLLALGLFLAVGLFVVAVGFYLLWQLGN
ncbi:MAG: hypothetical protein ABI599_09060 [Flavobacteriales bacterium]